MTQSEIDALIDLIEHGDLSGSELFEIRMRDAGRCLAERFSKDRNMSGKSIAIATCAQDREFFTEGLVVGLRDRAIHATVSTLWYKYQPRSNFVPAISALVAQHHEQHPDHVDAVAFVSSSLVEDATIADGLSRMSGRMGVTDLIVFSLAGSIAEQDSVIEQLAFRGVRRPHFCILGGIASNDLQSRGASIKSALTEHLARAYGRKGLGYLPQRFGGRQPSYAQPQPPTDN